MTAVVETLERGITESPTSLGITLSAMQGHFSRLGLHVPANSLECLLPDTHALLITKLMPESDGEPGVFINPVQNERYRDFNTDYQIGQTFFHALRKEASTGTPAFPAIDLMRVFFGSGITAIEIEQMKGMTETMDFFMKTLIELADGVGASGTGASPVIPPDHDLTTDQKHSKTVFKFHYLINGYASECRENGSMTDETAEKIQKGLRLFLGQTNT